MFFLLWKFGRKGGIDTWTGNPCWLNQNNWTYIELYNETVYGTKYDMKFCDRTDEMNEWHPRYAGKRTYLEYVAGEFLWTIPTFELFESIVPYNQQCWLDTIVQRYPLRVYAANNASSLQELTHAVWINDTDRPYWQRFWRDISPTNNSQSVWVETTYDATGSDWYPVIENDYGNQVYHTNIPDAKTKQFLGVLDDSGARFFISNPRNNTELISQPLALAMSYGSDMSYTLVGVLRTGASDVIVPDTRGRSFSGISCLEREMKSWW